MSILLPFYDSILKIAGMRVDEEGCISRQLGEQLEPVVIGDKRLVLPTDDQLRTPGANRVFFHPLRENILANESDVMAVYRRAVSERMHLAYLLLAYELVNLAGSQKLHAKLTPEQSEFLTCVNHVDDKTLETLRELIEAMPMGQSQKSFCSIYVKKMGKLDKKSHPRVAVVTFPFYRQLVEDGLERDRLLAQRKAVQSKEGEKKAAITVPNETYGVKLRVQDRETFIKIFEYLLPEIATPDAYSRASDSSNAPSLDALLKAVLALADPLNAHLNRFKKYLGKGYDNLYLDSSWVDLFENKKALDVAAQMVPMQAGNEGVVAGSKTAVAAEPVLAPLTVEKKEDALVESGVKEGTPQVKFTSNGMRIPDLPPQTPVNRPATTSIPKPYQPAPVQHHPIPPPPPYQPPQVEYTPDGKVNFNSVLRANPALAAQVSQAFPAMAPPPAANIPGWAQPSAPAFQPMGMAPAYGQPMGQTTYTTFNQAPIGQPNMPMNPGYKPRL